MKTNIIITGMPRSGKSTLIKSAINDFTHKVGFVTTEILKNHKRVGFKIETHKEDKAILAHINIKSNHKVSKYYVDVANLDSILPKASKFDDRDILYLDEIGEMELFSDRFEGLVLKYLDSANTCIATLSKIYSNRFIKQLRNRKDIILIELTPETRDKNLKYVKDLIRKIEKAKRYCNEKERFKITTNEVSIRTDHGVRVLNNKNNK